MTQLSCMLGTDRLNQALSRIGYFVTTKKKGTVPDYWAILHWFVNLAELNLSEMEERAFKFKQDEYRALQQESLNFNESEPPTIEKLLHLQHETKQRLSSLVDTGRLSMGPFPIAFNFYCPDNHPDFQGTDKYRHILWVAEHFDVLATFPETGMPLLYLLARCLQRYGDMVKSCRGCPKLFLRKRRVLAEGRIQFYCSRKCQSVMIMKVIRSRKPLQKKVLRYTLSTRTKKENHRYGKTKRAR